ncbi:rod shape-determining protein MreD [Weeksellaceae bacterium TAE3-ERU29]|nr:rod shape-determining protein MreD [Weeksellaceae bacterium TAE3-ERU29]
MAVFVLLQVAIFNNINFWGYANPYIYILFILLLPVSMNRYLLLMYAFIAGISIDLFEATGGVNAFTTVLVAYLRNPLIYLLSSNNINEPDSIKLSDFSFLQWSIYLVILILIQHITIDVIESMQWSKILTVIERSLIGSAITIILAAMYISFFPPKRQNDI